MYSPPVPSVHPPFARGWLRVARFGSRSRHSLTNNATRGPRTRRPADVSAVAVPAASCMAPCLPKPIDTATRRRGGLPAPITKRRPHPTPPPTPYPLPPSPSKLGIERRSGWRRGGSARRTRPPVGDGVLASPLVWPLGPIYGVGRTSWVRRWAQRSISSLVGGAPTLAMPTGMPWTTGIVLMPSSSFLISW